MHARFKEALKNPTDKSTTSVGKKLLYTQLKHQKATPNTTDCDPECTTN
jgi:hypothetical protein